MNHILMRICQLNKEKKMGGKKTHTKQQKGYKAAGQGLTKIKKKKMEEQMRRSGARELKTFGNGL